MNILDACGDVITQLVEEKAQLERKIYALNEENTLLRTKLFELMEAEKRRVRLDKEEKI